MDSNSKQNKSDFGSFLEGFKSRNLESVQAPVLNLIEQIIDISHELRAIFETSKVDAKELDEFIGECKKQFKVAESGDLINALDSIGMKMTAFIRFSKGNNKLPNVVNDVFTDLFAEYAKAAKMAEDNRLIKRAVEIGRLIESA
jgi:hypothetical protein